MFQGMEPTEYYFQRTILKLVLSYTVLDLISTHASSLKDKKKKTFFFLEHMILSEVNLIKPRS